MEQKNLNLSIKVIPVILASIILLGYCATALSIRGSVADVESVSAVQVVDKKFLADMETLRKSLEAAKKEKERKQKEYAYLTSRGRQGFSRLDLRTPTGYTAEQYNRALKGKAIEGQGWIFAKAEKERGVNGLFILALTGKEQSYGGANSGLKAKYNLTSYNATDSNPEGATTFDSYWDCIDTTASLLSNQYLNSRGKFYSNGYTVYHVNQLYATDKEWAGDIVRIMNELKSKIEARE